MSLASDWARKHQAAGPRPTLSFPGDLLPTAEITDAGGVSIFRSVVPERVPLLIEWLREWFGEPPA